MIQQSRRSGDEIVKEPVVISRPNGRIIHSLALMDRDINPLDFFSEEQTMYRATLGDLRFIGRFHPNGTLENLFLSLEYPSEDYRSVRDYLTYYGIFLSKYANAESAVYELRAWDINNRRLSWNDGIRLLNEINLDTLSDFQKEIVSRINGIDRLIKLHRPNLTAREMRSAVGSSTGGRLEIKPFVIS